jgi:adenylate cyclase
VGDLEGDKTMEGEVFWGKRMLLSDRFPQFSVLVHKSVDEQLLSYFELRKKLLLLFLINVLGLGMVVLKLARDISRPVSELSKATQEVEKGNLKYRLPVGGDDELGHLLRAFDHMVVDLAEKERIRTLLGKVVSPEIAEELLKSEIELGGEEKCVTIIFSDIRGFTNACEGEEPKRILDLLNIYLTEVANIIEEKNGVVDKFIGDAVMALFGAPISRDKDPQNAVDAALAMEEMLVRLNLDLEKKGYSRIDIGIGIHTGIVVAGNMGSKNRLNYTVIGDNVNLSARLEGLTKFYGVSTIISAATKSLCVGHFLYVDCVQVKGKTEAVEIFSPLRERLEMEEKQEYEEALTLYRGGYFEEASSIFIALHQKTRRNLYKMYHERCLSFEVKPPDDWKGVYRFVSK